MSGWIRSYRAQAAVDVTGAPIPWYRYAAIDFIAKRVSPDWDVFEFGSGNSTLWWAARTRSITAVEHEPSWAEGVRADAPANARILSVPLETDGDYCRTAERLGTTFHVIIIDGRDRVNCALHVLDALSDDGVLIWDDSQRRRYAPGLGFLRRNGFRQLEFTGLGPINPTPGETSILYRDANCFGI